MGVSFKVSRTGNRYRPRLVSQTEVGADDCEASHNCNESSLAASKNEPSSSKLKGDIVDGGDGGISSSSMPDHEVSFTLNLYPDGYSIGKPSENGYVHQAGLQDGQKLLLPYDRTSENFFLAIESGHLPGDIMDDIPCEFVNGMLICELRDFRKCVFEHKLGIPSANTPPVFNRVSLRMSLENIVKDIPSISDNSWTYGDLMEVEARILKALQPQLCLDPTPRLDRLCSNPIPKMLNLGVSDLRRKRLREMQIPEVGVTTNNGLHGQRVCLDRVLRTSSNMSADSGSISGNVTSQHVLENLTPQNLRASNVPASRAKNFAPDGNAQPLPSGLQQSGYQVGCGAPRSVQDQGWGSLVNISGVSSNGQDMYENVNTSSSSHGKRDTSDGRMSPLSSLNKRAKMASATLGDIQQQQIVPHIEGLHASDMNWQNPIAGGIQYSNAGIQKKSSHKKSVVTSVPAVGATTSLTSDNYALQWQPPPQASSKRRASTLPKTVAINGAGSPVGVSNNACILLNANSPSVGTPAMSDQIMIEQFSKIQTVAIRHQLTSKKHKVDNFPARKPNSYSCESLSACLSNASNNEDFRDDSSRTQLSKSLVGGHMNVCKTRVINFKQADRILQGNAISDVHRIVTRMTMSEKPNDGTVAMHYGEIEDGDVLSAEEYLPSLPNTHFADLLAAQLCSLMIREGYIVEDHIQPRPIHINTVSNQMNASGIPPNNSLVKSQQGQASSEVKPIVSSTPSINSSQNPLANARMLALGSSQALQFPQASTPEVPMCARPQQPEPQVALQPLAQQTQPSQQPQQLQNQLAFGQQQHSHFQRPPMVPPSNTLPQLNGIGQNLNVQLGGHMVNKASPLHSQLLQQQLLLPQQQQLPHMQQREMKMGLGTAMSVANVRNNIVGLRVGNALGVGSVQGGGISGPMAPTGMNTMGQNPMNLGPSSQITHALSQQLRRGQQLTPAQAALLQEAKIRMAQRQPSMLGGPLAGIARMSGGMQNNPGSAGLSMLGQSLNQANMNSIQRSTIGPMGPPNLTVGMNPYANQQQQQQLQLQQQQQQQELTSSLQAVISPSQVGSPSTIEIPQLNQQPQMQPSLHQPSPQQISQQTPMSPQVSSGMA